MGSLMIRMLFCLCLALAASTAMAQEVRLHSLNPWCNRNADDLGNALRPAQPLKLQGMVNDWLVGAAAVTADKQTDVTVSFEGSKELQVAADLKVVGEVPAGERNAKPIWCLDPVIADPRKLGDLSEDVRNWAAIRDFPRLHLTADRPVMLWLTVKTHSLRPGVLKGRIVITEAAGTHSAMTVEVEVQPVTLPVENPIMGYCYTSFRERRELAQMALDYGMNVCRYYDNWDMCRELGFRFFSFAIPFVNPRGVDMDTEDEQVVKEGIEPIKEIIARLKLKPQEWGIEIFDEPFDKLAWAYVAWGVRLRRLWPEAQFWTNLGYANQGRNRATVAGSINPMKPYVNFWCPYIKYLEPSSADVLRAIRATGKPIWYYIVTFRHGLPPDGGWWMPWLAWKYHLQGWSFYSLDASGKDTNPWRDNVCARSYPGNTPSLWLEALRQGVQDYKRLWLLEQRGIPRKQLDRLADRVVSCPDHLTVAARLDQCQSVRRELDRMLLRH